MIQRKDTFLSRPEWLTIPWTKHPKTPRDLILDIIVTIPALSVSLTAFVASPPRPQDPSWHRTRLSIRAALLDLSFRLRAWHDRYAAPVLPATLTADLPPDISASQLADAHCMTLYWSMSMRTAQFVRQLSLPHEPLDQNVDEDAACRHLVRAMRLFFHPRVGLFRHFTTAMPLSTAIHYLSTTSADPSLEPERRVLRDMLARPEAHFVRQFVRSLEPESYKQDTPSP